MMEPVRDPAELRGDLAPHTHATAVRKAMPHDGGGDPRDAVLANIQASYFFLRRGMAVLALAFPLALWIGGGLADLQPSISAYYHADGGAMRDVFVGGLWAIGAFLFLYKGYSRAEDWALNLAGVLALGIALVPMDWGVAPDAPASTAGMIHGTCAVGYFLAIAYVAVFRAKDTLPALADEAVRARFRRRYATAGALMAILPLGIAALHWIAPDRSNTPGIFFAEMAGTYVFAIFWLMKSREIALIEKQR